MNTKIIASLGIMTAFVSLGNSAYAQSPLPSTSSTDQYTVNGDSLIGIDKRTAQDDFLIFFEQNNTRNIPTTNRRNNSVPVKLSPNESLSLPNTPVLLAPIQSGDDTGNNAVQLQLDLGRE